MLLYPSQDNLLEKVNSKYSLVILASKRAHELQNGAMPLLTEYQSVKEVGQALEEIEAGDLVIDYSEKK
ncbi:DNA-directed RNA polymerase subunit omega [Lacticigenium naphthae]|uniref:DNA-directed RNA polymerase subunit omega n=1 Tax=Lacticigenium naphthae TaxID=515351 RepID=UPI0003FEE9BE|nr:DNA-directed RNA polymerase subunit omega [Lacticigenium naphthae]